MAHARRIGLSHLQSIRPSIYQPTRTRIETNPSKGPIELIKLADSRLDDPVLGQDPRASGVRDKALLLLGEEPVEDNREPDNLFQFEDVDSAFRGEVLV